ncbi:oxygen-independent coproporphyrinogen III oxidase [Pseudohalioglobus sediminis]|uniref:Coproporphyrinogen-III oxidase n=1 Tax=Pseudohalioglobus sediminis TaxID=2606449 RepID=A0A5B0X288_9GAMM|nr:oxygen-independent coproporphyrinogen III oxidase [Pseudohalioglobus sediminis]KAA1193366.1 oxygen-independent coproporphyrinogen III oxidase [Pseudohalioglobus sediminis]
MPKDLVASTALPAKHQAEMDLARKYASQGPRYTSYPTAPQFRQDFPLQGYRDWQGQDGDHKREPLSLYLHIPFCNDICYYCACNKIVTREKNVAQNYLGHLQREIAMQAELVGNQRPITQMHWGGGTPTYLDNAQITELMHLLASHFRLLDKGYREYSIEIDPRTIETSTIALLKGVGFNRISLGIQDFDPLVQKSVNRIQPFSQIAALVNSIRSHDFRSLSFDLIYGLPHQDRYSMAETLRKVIELRPDRIACYNYAHLPERFSSQRAIDRLTLPEPDEKLLLHEIISHTLQEAGYLHIGMDHFVLPEDELALAQVEGRLQRNFQGYSLKMADDLLGLGVSAISQIGDFYLQNERELNGYYKLLDEGELPITRGCKVSDDDKLRRHIIMTLISELRLDIIDCNRQFGIDFEQQFARELAGLAPMIADDLLTLSDSAIEITPRGRPFLRNICMLFDAYLGAHKGDEPPPNFSATV